MKTLGDPSDSRTGSSLSGPRPERDRSRARRAVLRICAVVSAVAGLATLYACEGCRPTTSPATSDAAQGETPQARLYLVSDLAGALEPCGCVKDQLGGMDHFGALVHGDKNKSIPYATLSAGPLFFMDMDLPADKKSQETEKAETIAASMKTLHLAAFAPSRNSFAAGADMLAKLRDESDAALVAANLEAGKLAPAKSKLVDVGGIKVGVIGVAAPERAEKALAPLAGITSSPASAAVKSAAEALKKEGAQALVVLAAVGRGEAKRIADENPDLLAVLVGSTGASGDTNTKAAPPEQVGNVLVVETANHLQSVGVLDLYLRGARPTSEGGPVKFSDATGIERMRKREELTGRIDELRKKIATWETDKSVDARDVAARKADVTKLEAERDALEKSPLPASGSYYRYAMREIREDLGSDETIKGQMNAFYKKVNDANKVAFKNKVPEPAPKGSPTYVGIDTCANCHEAPKQVWDHTGHANAYATLEKQFKEANLDCVGCHVTGYDKPGGSTVTHVDGLKNVQCEVCHGPGSLHAAKPDSVKIPVARPSANMCLDCHHPPHVHTFDAAAKMADILGPGHGRPLQK